MVVTKSCYLHSFGNLKNVSFFYLYLYLEIVLTKVQYVLENCTIAHFFKKDFKGFNFLI